MNRSIPLCLCALIAGCSFSPQPQPAPSEPVDTTPLIHTYRPERFTVLSPYACATGTVKRVMAMDDGDTHIHLIPDAQHRHLLAPLNGFLLSGALVVEIVCSAPIKEEIPREACAGYESDLFIPRKGDRVRVCGHYVREGKKGWTEIHPAYSLERAD